MVQTDETRSGGFFTNSRVLLVLGVWVIAILLFSLVIIEGCESHHERQRCNALREAYAGDGGYLNYSEWADMIDAGCNPKQDWE
ncbi:hypothetical protein [Candidatus Poriferisocius sp.]|uniref:hypothetical protein n=1 Tax=Candidatus Poriferisocius sp. TaxID=3101276 RepID=UPI003B01239C